MATTSCCTSAEAAKALAVALFFLRFARAFHTPALTRTSWGRTVMTRATSEVSVEIDRVSRQFDFKYRCRKFLTSARASAAADAFGCANPGRRLAAVSPTSQSKLWLAEA
jgi:hypothetical protein